MRRETLSIKQQFRCYIKSRNRNPFLHTDLQEIGELYKGLNFMKIRYIVDAVLKPIRKLTYTA